MPLLGAACATATHLTSKHLHLRKLLSVSQLTIALSLPLSPSPHLSDHIDHIAQPLLFGFFAFHFDFREHGHQPRDHLGCEGEGNDSDQDTYPEVDSG